MRLGLLAQGPEEADQAKTKGGHGECGPDPCEGCSLESEASAKGGQTGAPLGERNARVGLCTGHIRTARVWGREIER
jgi:hypothetical protein